MRTNRLMASRSLLFVTSFVVLACLVHFLPDHFFRPIQTLLVTVTLPFQNLFSWTAFELRQGTDLLGSLGTLKEENERLHQELLAREGDQALAQSVREENEELRRLLELSTKTDRTLVLGEVIHRERHQSTTRTLRLNRGERQGIRVGMPVVAEGSVLIGRIESVAPFTAEVELLSHRDSVVAVNIEGVTGEAILRGDRGSGLLLDLVRPNEKLEAGARIVTAGFGDGLPNGLLVGTVETRRLSADQLFQQATVLPPLRADRLRFMAVITAF